MSPSSGRAGAPASGGPPRRVPRVGRDVVPAVASGAMTALAAAGLEERDRELEAVAAALEAARSGAGAALLVEGPPGVGKTRLLAPARAAAGDAVRVLAARGSELERDFPFAVVRQLLEPAAEPQLLTGAAALAAPVLQDSAAAVEAGPAALHGLYWLTA